MWRVDMLRDLWNVVREEEDGLIPAIYGMMTLGSLMGAGYTYWQARRILRQARENL